MELDASGQSDDSRIRLYHPPAMLAADPKRVNTNLCSNVEGFACSCKEEVDAAEGAVVVLLRMRGQGDWKAKLNHPSAFQS